MREQARSKALKVKNPTAPAATRNVE